MIDFTQKCTKRKMSKIKMYEKKNVQNQNIRKEIYPNQKVSKQVFSLEDALIFMFLFKGLLPSTKKV
jgi:predicted membrane protein